MIVKIKNKDDSSGTIVVKATSSSFIIDPSAKNTPLFGSTEVTFNLKASPNTQDNGRIDVEVCSVSQFGGENCDTDSVTIDIVDIGIEKDCGDNVCQFDIGETKTTCPEDCLRDNIEICGNGIDDDLDTLVDYADPDCKVSCGCWIDNPLGNECILKNMFCLINNFIFKFKLALSIIIGFLTALIGALGFNRLKEVYKLKSPSYVALIVGAVLGISIGYLAFVYFWIGLIGLIIFGSIKFYLP